MRIAQFDIGHAVRPADGFAVGGDAVVAGSVGDRIVLVIVDVLGHGPEAHAVASKLEGMLARPECNDAAALLGLIEAALAGSVGAAAAVATLQSEDGSGVYVGVGNTVARIFGRNERRLVSVDGVVGHARGAPRPMEFRLGAGDVLVLHTDGISSRFAGTEYPQLPTEDVQVSARELIRRFGKTYDDAACIVARRSA